MELTNENILIVARVVSALAALFFIMSWLLYPAEPVCPEGSRPMMLATTSVCVVEPLGWR